MSSVRGIIRNGQVEVATPIDLPDGTEIVIPLPDPGETSVADAPPWSDTPEAAEAWIRWYDSLEPLEFTPEERAALQAARREDKSLELDQWDKHSQQIEGQFS